MKTITPEQAQQLANILGMFIAVDDLVRGGQAYASQEAPVLVIADRVGLTRRHGLRVTELPIHITDTRPWTEQIWRPEV